MFELSLGSRKKFDRRVDRILSASYEIKTRNSDNIPGMNSYAQLLDGAWEKKMSADECAMHVATMYALGLSNKGLVKEAETVADKINRIYNFNRTQGFISVNVGEHYIDSLSKINGRENKEPDTLQPASASMDKQEENNLVTNEDAKGTCGYMKLSEDLMFADQNIAVDQLPDPTSVRESFTVLSQGLSTKACTALLSRLSALNLTVAACQIHETGDQVKDSSVRRFFELWQYSLVIQKTAPDRHVLETRLSVVDEHLDVLFKALGNLTNVESLESSDVVR